MATGPTAGRSQQVLSAASTTGVWGPYFTLVNSQGVFPADFEQGTMLGKIFEFSLY